MIVWHMRWTCSGWACSSERRTSPAIPHTASPPSRCSNPVVLGLGFLLMTVLLTNSLVTGSSSTRPCQLIGFCLGLRETVPLGLFDLRCNRSEFRTIPNSVQGTGIGNHKVGEQIVFRGGESGPGHIGCQTRPESVGVQMHGYVFFIARRFSQVSDVAERSGQSQQKQAQRRDSRFGSKFRISVVRHLPAFGKLRKIARANTKQWMLGRLPQTFLQ